MKSSLDAVSVVTHFIVVCTVFGCEYQAGRQIDKRFVRNCLKFQSNEKGGFLMWRFQMFQTFQMFQDDKQKSEFVEG